MPGQLLGKNGLTIDKLREVIRVTPKEEAILRASALHSPILAEQIERVLRHRVLVAQEFERLILLFANIPAADCREIVSAARATEFSRRNTIFLEGDTIRQVVLLTSGSAKVMRLGHDGTEVILRLAGPGDVVEMTGFPAQCRHCSTAQALSASTALIWEASAFQDLAERFPALRRNILKVAAQRLEELEERYREISTERVATRLSHQLLRLFNQLGRRVNGNGTLKISLSREELAQLTGTTLFTVSRLLSKWKERGVLTAGHECVYIHNIQALLEFAENE